MCVCPYFLSFNPLVLAVGLLIFCFKDGRPVTASERAHAYVIHPELQPAIDLSAPVTETPVATPPAAAAKEAPPTRANAADLMGLFSSDPPTAPAAISALSAVSTSHTQRNGNASGRHTTYTHAKRIHL